MLINATSYAKSNALLSFCFDRFNSHSAYSRFSGPLGYILLTSCLALVSIRSAVHNATSAHPPSLLLNTATGVPSPLDQLPFDLTRDLWFDHGVSTEAYHKSVTRGTVLELVENYHDENNEAGFQTRFINVVASHMLSNENQKKLRPSFMVDILPATYASRALPSPDYFFKCTGARSGLRS